MTTLIALLRGINVGHAKRVAMADLRALLQDLGYTEVRTLLQSGNAVFSAPGAHRRGAAATIEAAFAARFGFSSRIIVLTAAEFGEIIAENPLTQIATDPSRLLVSIFANPADRSRLDGLLAQDWGRETLAVGSRAAYLWCPDGVLDNRLSEAVSKALRDALTTRNWATTMKIHALAA
jgi:uncharacterized protein (DUF1697 family)